MEPAPARYLYANTERANTERRSVIYERDLNGNETPERFYEIDGKKVFLSVDGRDVEDILNE